MRNRVRPGLAAGLFLAAWLGPAATSRAAAAPTAHLLDAGTAAVGSQVVVQGTGWPASTVVNLQVCGNAAIDGSSDCDLGGAANAGVSRFGAFSMSLTVAKPPTACPCVVWVTDLSSVREARVPLPIVDLPSALPHYQVVSPNLSDLVRIAGARVSGGTGWLTSLGWPSHRTLVVDLVNTSAVPIHQALLTEHIGSGARPTGVLPSLRVSLAPHGAATERIPVDLGWFANGSYDIRGELGAFGTPATFSLKTAAHLWGLLIVGLVAVQCGLLVLRNRLRRRLRRAEAPQPDGARSDEADMLESEGQDPMDERCETRPLDDLIGAGASRSRWPRLAVPWGRVGEPGSIGRAEPLSPEAPAEAPAPAAAPTTEVLTAREEETEPPVTPAPAPEPQTAREAPAEPAVILGAAAQPWFAGRPVAPPAARQTDPARGGTGAPEVPAAPSSRPGAPFELIPPDLAAVLAEQDGAQELLVPPQPARTDLRHEQEHLIDALRAEADRAANRLRSETDVAIVRVKGELEGALRRLRAELEAESAQTRLAQLAYTERIRQAARACLLLLDEASVEPDGPAPVDRSAPTRLGEPSRHPSET